MKLSFYKEFINLYMILWHGKSQITIRNIKYECGRQIKSCYPRNESRKMYENLLYLMRHEILLSCLAHALRTQMQINNLNPLYYMFLYI